MFLLPLNLLLNNNILNDNDNDNDNGRRWIDNSAIDNVEILINENRTRSPKVVIVARKVVVQHL